MVNISLCSLRSSYTYDLTQNLQYNMSLIDRPFCKLHIKIGDRLSERSCKESDSCVQTKKLKGGNRCQECLKHCVQQHHFVSRHGKPCGQFIWNKHMLKLLNDVVHPDWLLYITHGFVGQCSILSLLDWLNG